MFKGLKDVLSFSSQGDCAGCCGDAEEPWSMGELAACGCGLSRKPPFGFEFQTWFYFCFLCLGKMGKIARHTFKRSESPGVVVHTWDRSTQEPEAGVLPEV